MKPNDFTERRGTASRQAAVQFAVPFQHTACGRLKVVIVGGKQVGQRGLGELVGRHSEACRFLAQPVGLGRRQTLEGELHGHTLRPAQRSNKACSRGLLVRF